MCFNAADAAVTVASLMCVCSEVYQGSGVILSSMLCCALLFMLSFRRWQTSSFDSCTTFYILFGYTCSFWLLCSIFGFCVVCVVLFNNVAVKSVVISDIGDTSIGIVDIMISSETAVIEV